MPLFFLTAGLLAHSAIHRDWRAVCKRRILVLLWPYILWSVAFGSFAGFAYYPESPLLYTLYRWAAIPFASTAYWFLAVLIVFFVLAKALRRQRWLVLGAASVLAIAAPFVEPLIEESLPSVAAYALVRVLRYSVWYFLGCYGVSAVKQGVKFSPWFLLGGGGVLFAGLTWVAWSFDLSAPFSLPVSVAGLVASVGMSVLAVRNGRVKALSTYLAQRTLPIYLLHPVLINLAVLVAILSGAELAANDFAATLLTPLLTIAAVGISVLVYDCLQGTRMEWLYRPPSWSHAVTERD